MKNFTAVLMMEVTNQDHQHVIEDFAPHIENLGWKKIASDIFVFKKEFENCLDSGNVEFKVREELPKAKNSFKEKLCVDYFLQIDNGEIFRVSI